MKTTTCITLCCVMAATQFSHAAETSLTDSEIKAILRERIEVAKKGIGMVVGLVDERGTRVVSYGRFERGSGRDVDGNSVFEIGSATKVFTTVLLQDMVERGKMKLDDPVAKYLPKSVHIPTRGAKEVTLLDLATHTSALPRMPDNFKPKDPHNPYADFTVAQLYACLSGCTLKRDIGAKYEYSNLGMGLLGHVLALKAGKSYEALVVEQICRPLKMDNTRIKLDAKLKVRLAPGHTETLEPQANWDLPTLAGAGALRSTINDLLRFLSANLGLTKSSLTPTLRKSHAIRFRGAAPDLDIALGWHVAHKFGSDIIWHNGQTGGYHSFIGFDPNKRRGVVILSNSANSIDDIALHLLESQYKLADFKPAKEHKVAKIDYKLYDAYAGRYELAPNVFFTIRRDGDRLMAQLTGQTSLEIFPESDTEFFYKAVDAQLTFVKNAKGEVTALILHQNGQHPAAVKVK
ncbi:MAG: serine hydrolase [Verrucomicrobiia bacterium]|jgi:CubicO group peptidase (beta-lactamase class C family)